MKSSLKIVGEDGRQKPGSDDKNRTTKSAVVVDTCDFLRGDEPGLSYLGRPFPKLGARRPQQEPNMSSALAFVDSEQIHMPEERQAITHEFRVGTEEGKVTVGLYEDGRPGEIRISMGGHGTTISGMLNVFSTSVSLCLQHGVPLHALVDKFSFTQFEPQGFTGNQDVPMAKSVVDYVFRWLSKHFDA
jgi:hypothetical protein